MLNEVKLDFLGISQNESFARGVVANFVSQCDVTIEQLSDIKTAVSEAVTNAIVHGYKGTTGMVTLACRLYSSNDRFTKTLEIAISDNGIGISNVEKAREPLFTTQPEMERSGMGFTVMETFMDDVTVRSAPKCGCIVTMRKTL
ncbi:MAG: anti-sigma F factor [Clostridiales bacterium]|nr:anti-sigma F factor [Clostridiales bacterium]